MKLTFVIVVASDFRKVFVLRRGWCVLCSSNTQKRDRERKSNSKKRVIEQEKAIAKSV